MWEKILFLYKYNAFMGNTLNIIIKILKLCAALNNYNLF